MSLDDYVQADATELHTYLSTKGDFEWGEDVLPHYEWFDGQVEYTLGDESIDPEAVVEVNRIDGDPEDGVSRIWPFKRMEGRQAYDAGNDKLAYSHVWGPDTDTAYWTNFDWDKAITAGMKAAGKDYSGEYDFVDTHMYWPITHMVAPAENALECEACHAKDGRLVSLAGIYTPGTNPFNLPGLAGLLILLATVGGVALHGAIRIVAGGARHD